MKDKKTYTENRSGKEVFLELPFKVENGYTKAGKKKFMHFAPSLNRIISLSRKKFVWDHYKADAEEQLAWEIKKQTREKFDKPVAVTFQRHAVRLLDWDNSAASFKLIGDSLVKAGVLEDDDPTHIAKYYPEQYKVSSYKDEKIIVKIWEI